MKTKLLWVLIILAQNFYAQDIVGTWKGELDIQGTKLPLIFTVKKQNNTYTSTAKSPLQSDEEIPVDQTAFVNNELTLSIESLGASYKGQFKKDHFEGNFTQRSASLPLNLTRSASKEAEHVAIADLGNRAINTQKIDDYLSHIVKNKQSVGSISIFRNGKEVYQKSFGQEQLPGVKWDKTTGYQIGSISKFFTAVMLMQSVEKGNLKLTDKLSQYYPDMPNADKITIEQMMNHTSGLGDYVGEKYQWLFGKSVGDKVILDTIKKRGVLFQPGENTRYSNSGYYLLSRILEKISKKPYHNLLKENILTKSKMENTYSVLDNPKNIFRSYQNNAGKWISIEDFDFRNCVGLGDITSTPTDMNLFINTLFDYKLISKESLEKMLPDYGKPFGLGVMPIPFYDKISYGHGGDTAGTHSMLWYNPGEDYSVALTINGEKMPHNSLAIGILNIIYDQKADFPTFD